MTNKKETKYRKIKTQLQLKQKSKTSKNIGFDW